MTGDPESIQICAFLTRIIFEKNETGFLIGSFEQRTKNDENKDDKMPDFLSGVDYLNFSALGSIINPQVGMEYKLTGEWGDDSRFGKQFKFSSFETVKPTDTNGIFKYIVRICKFVGATVGTKIVDEFGDQALVIMKTDPFQVADKIRGITALRATEIQATLLDNEATEAQMVELVTLLDIPGMRKALPTELIKRFKANAVGALNKNPYILTEFNGVGFPLADRVALNIGYARDGVERKKAAALHCIKESQQQDGNVWTLNTDLVSRMQEYIQVPDLSEGIHALLEAGTLVNDENYFAMAGPAADEAYIAKKIYEMMKFGPREAAA